MTNAEYLNAVSDMNVVGDIIAFKAPNIVDESTGFVKAVYRIGQIQSYTPTDGSTNGSKTVKTRGGAEFTVGDVDGTRWTFQQWDKGQYPAVRVNSQLTPAPIKRGRQTLIEAM